jgi:hypothetical protein
LKALPGDGTADVLADHNVAESAEWNEKVAESSKNCLLLLVFRRLNQSRNLHLKSMSEFVVEKSDWPWYGSTACHFMSKVTPAAASSPENCGSHPRNSGQLNKGRTESRYFVVELSL